MKKYAVSISARTTNSDRDYGCIGPRYVPFLEGLGLLPVLVPNNTSDPCAYVAALGVEGLILTGGGDLDPERYAQPNTHSIEIAPARDRTEFCLLAMAAERRLPVLGICRGLQVLNAFFGGTLVQDIPAQIGASVQHDGSLAHPVRIVDARVQRLTGVERLAVNSHHHQGVTAHTLAPVLNVFALSEPDGVIEGVLHRSLPVLGVQWHPEQPTPSEAFDRVLFTRFFEGPFWLEDV